MPAQERLLLEGAAGAIEVVIDHPELAPGTAPRGIALIAHPHPLFGGSLDNKVAQTLARVFTELGYVAIRPNFRGVGASDGKHDHGNGEADDMVAVAEQARARFGAHFGELPVALAGFSFGAFVQTHVAVRVSPERMVLIGLAAGLVAAERKYVLDTVPADTIIIHGEKDETVLLANVLDWARPQDLPVVVIPGADHFFHRRLHIIRNIIKGQWR
jgi:alpha/beta superfamily hydrolase